MKKTSVLRVSWVMIVLLAASLCIQTVPVQAIMSDEDQTNISRIEWDAYYFGDVPAGQEPEQWYPFSSMDSDHTEARSARDLWLRASLPEGNGTLGQLLVYYYMVENYEISLYVDGTPLFTSDKLLPSGFISWRIIPYEKGSSGNVLLARLSPHQYLEEGFEVWSGSSSAITLKLLRTEAPLWGGAIVLLLFSVIYLLFYLYNRSQLLFFYLSVFFLSLSIDLSVLWGGWQYVLGPDNLMMWGSIIHINWYVGHAAGILMTHSIVSEKGSKWIRNLGYAVFVYAIIALAGWLLFGEKVQLLFYQAFYTYISTSILLVLAVVLVRTLLRRRDIEIRIFAIGNVVFIGGLGIGRFMSGQIWLFPSKQALLTSQHALAQIGWTFIGFFGMLICFVIIMALRLMHIAQLRSTNMQLSRVNGELKIANDKLSHIDDIRSNMYSEVSHELNTPITAIKGYVQLMLNGTIPWGEKRYLKVIHDKSVVMERMI